MQNENRHLLESLAILLSTPSRFVESLEGAIKDRIRELLLENKDKTAVGTYPLYSNMVIRKKIFICRR